MRMGWSTSEDLLCIQEDGNVLVYNLFGSSKETVHCSISAVSKLYSLYVCYQFVYECVITSF